MAQSFTGHYRPTHRSPWVALVTAPTWGECWAMLLRALPSGNGEALVRETCRPPQTGRGAFKGVAS